MKPCTNCARPGKLTICEDCAYRAESILRPLIPWTKFEQAIMPKDDALHAEGFTEVWKNSRYQVWIRRPTSDVGELIHLSIKRNDRNPMHDWRDLQRIKNEILGKEEEAVELYPAESRLVDAANQYHLWCFKGQRAPFGYEVRAVIGPTVIPGNELAKQRPFETPPDDLMSEEEFQKKAAVLRERGAARADFSKRMRTILDSTARSCETTMKTDCLTNWPEAPVQWCAACLARELRRMAVEASDLCKERDVRNATIKEAKDALTKAAAMTRIGRAEAGLYRAAEAVADARRELSALVGGGINLNCERLAGLDARIKREIHELGRRREAGQCDLDETMKTILQREAEGKRPAKKKGAR